MAYLALYRKLRPKTFDDVIGQEYIIKTLKNQIEKDRITHAYLFCGTRGTGKTSTAKIFAKLLNCGAPINNSPCGTCEMCVSSDENVNLNIIEIDAASNNGVDDIREIREEVKYPPTNGKFKIYIIDEVHMLSIGAFNALLKTLEEPPKYVIFILATTDPQKIPVTVLSRCQRFDFKRISNKDMINSIKQHMKEEDISINDDAISYIVKISDGAMRDALSILDQCISFYYNEEITLEKVLDIVGSVDDAIFFQFIDAIIEYNFIEVINLIDDLIYNGRDISQFVSDLINHLRNLIIVKISAENNSNLDISLEKYNMLKDQAKKVDTNYIVKLINDFSNMQNILRYSLDARITLETTCIKLCNSVSSENIDDIKEKIRLIEKKLEEDTFNKVNTIYIEKDRKEKPKLRELALSDDIKLAIDNYGKIIDSFKEPQKIYLEKAVPKSLEDKFLYLVTSSPFVSSLQKMKCSIEDTLYNLFNKNYEIRILSTEEYNVSYKKIASKEPKKVSDNSTIDYNKIEEAFPNNIIEID